MDRFNTRFTIALLMVAVMLLCENQGGWWVAHYFYLMTVCLLFALAPFLLERWERRLNGQVGRGEG
jgi:hypothetical protein